MQSDFLIPVKILQKKTNNQVKKHLNKKTSQMYKNYPVIKNDINLCFKTKKIIKREITLNIPPDAEKKCFLVRYSFSFSDYIIMNITDITERQRAENILRESELKYRSLVKTSQDLIWKGDKQGRFIYLNPSWSDILGYQLSEMLGQPFYKFKPPELSPKDRKSRKKIMNGGEINGYKTDYISKTGNTIN